MTGRIEASSCSKPASRAGSHRNVDGSMASAPEASGGSVQSEGLPPRPWHDREQLDAETSSASDGFLTAAEYRSHKSGDSKVSRKSHIMCLHALL
jgi:hypothetical protein